MPDEHDHGQVDDFLILDFVRSRGETTRPEIARELGFARPSVNRLVGRLITSGLITEHTETADTGRSRARISTTPRKGSVVAIDLGGTKCHGALADLGGMILAEQIIPTHGAATPYESLLACLNTLRDEGRRRALPATAVAVGVPAIVDAGSGRAIAGPNVQWEGFDLAGRLARDLDLPFVVENDANLAALGHAWRGAGRHTRDFVTIAIGTGIGAAAIVNGKLVKGSHNAAGEIGYMVLTREQLRESGRGGLGGFERVAAGPGIERRAVELLTMRPEVDSVLRAGSPISSEAVFEAARSHDPIARQVVDELLDDVAIAIIAVTGALDPERVILDGGVGRSLEPFVSEIARRVVRHVPVMPDLCVSRIGPNATVVGAIAAALRLSHSGHRGGALATS